MKKQFTSMVLTSVMVAGNIATPLALENSKSSETKAELNKIKNEKNALISKNKDIENELDKAQHKISKTKNDLQTVLNEKVRNEEELNKTEKQLDEEYIALKEQIANYYMNSYSSNVSILKELITSKDASEFIVTSSHLKYIVDDRDKKVDNVSKLLEKQKELSKKIESDENRLKALQSDLVSEQKSLESASKENKKKIFSLKEKEAELEDILVVQQEEEARIKAAILKKQEEERQRLEEEKKRQEALKNEITVNQIKEEDKVENSTTTSNTVSSKSLRRPVDSYRITSKFGWRIHPITGNKKFHNGIDLAAPKGTPILSSQDGEVVIAQYSSSYGNYIVVNHGGGLSTLYAHLESMSVGVGAKVARGQLIGTMGSTGMSTGSHLHYEVRVNGEKVDPMSKVNL